MKFAEWFGTIVSPDMGQIGVGAPECLNTTQVTNTDMDAENAQTMDTFLKKMALTHVSFFAICILLTIPAIAGHERWLHSTNARTAVYTLALGSLVRSCARCLDCSQEVHEWCSFSVGEDDSSHCHTEHTGTYHLDVLPSVQCFRGSHTVVTIAAAILLTIYGVLIPAYLFLKVRAGAKDSIWTHDELVCWGWLILKYKPNRWWFEFPMLFYKIFFVLLAMLMDSERWAWEFLLAAAALTSILLILVFCDKPFRDASGRAEGQLTLCDIHMMISLCIQLIFYGLAAASLHLTNLKTDADLNEDSQEAIDDHLDYISIAGASAVAFQLCCVLYVAWHDLCKDFNRKDAADGDGDALRDDTANLETPATKNPLHESEPK